MNRIVLTILLSVSTFAWAGTGLDASEYTINIHVATSRMVIEGTSIAHSQKLTVVIGGKKYELESEAPVNSLFSLGDYKAKLVRDDHHESYDSYQVYELLLPDNKTRKFVVVGQTE